MAKRILVLGGYGLIGAACLRALRDAGFDATGMGRSERAALATAPDIPWMLHDLTRLTVGDWTKILAGFDTIVNAAGALQDGAKDNLHAIHVTLPDRLSRAVSQQPDPPRVIQISAAGVRPDAGTDFFCTKAKGDAIITKRLPDHVILRPTLVLAPEAYGGTALLRAAAALPLFHPEVYARAQVQTVYVDDVAAAVVAAANDEIAAGTIADLTESRSRNLPELIGQLRLWLGFAPARIHLTLPEPLLRLTGCVADLLGHLGWRSPLRSNALLSLEAGITGDPEAWRKAGGRPCRALDDTLRAMPATAQDRLFARAYLLVPLSIAVLSLFWLLSGLITLAQPEAARVVLSSRDAPQALITPLVIGGAVADIGLGLAVLIRRWTRKAALGMVALSLAYLGGSLIFSPDLWADPLGPMVKVLPATMLAFFTALIQPER